MKIIISGFGKMGKKIKAIAQMRGHSIINISDSKHPLTNLDVTKCDVVIDFSTPSTALDNILYSLINNTPIVSGTTSWLSNIDKVKNLCLEKKGAFLYSANFSLGMNIFFQINKQIAEIMKSHEYKCEVNEVHHTNKIDSPSGTALVLKEDIQKIYGQNININSERLNKTVGIHNIKYESNIDEIIITHISKNRDGFALGAILAAEWIVGKTGFFTMKDVLKF
ncbi:MAG: 4-hydroxy-tetrahydrodipicolinate reductase [Flavobacteriales bacterium]|nr:4-hydroxy-tetrahydrodipicolinate reductase [Flavobacteriales bacterium]